MMRFARDDGRRSIVCSHEMTCAAASSTMGKYAMAKSRTNNESRLTARAAVDGRRARCLQRIQSLGERIV